MASTRARIALDAMGGDDAPAAIVAGAIQAQTELAAALGAAETGQHTHHVVADFGNGVAAFHRK